jgi:hypothetical protein
MRLIEENGGNILDEIFMPSNFGERGAAVPALQKLTSAYPHEQEKDYAL